jgi:hypothetical protein
VPAKITHWVGVKSSQCYLLHEPVNPHCGLICGLTASINPLLTLTLITSRTSCCERFCGHGRSVRLRAPWNYASVGAVIGSVGPSFPCNFTSSRTARRRWELEPKSCNSGRRQVCQSLHGSSSQGYVVVIAVLDTLAAVVLGCF